MRQRIGCAALMLVGLVANAPSDEGRQFGLVEAWVGQSLVPFLGSRDRREVIAFALGYDQKPPRFLYRNNNRLVIEGYYHRSNSQGGSNVKAVDTDSVGILAFLRYRLIDGRSAKLYSEFGLGLNYANRTSADLDSRLNTTPMFGLSLGFPQGDGRELQTGIRLLHISNAGTSGSNQGQNQLLLVLGYRF